MKTERKLKILGRYNVGDLQLALRVVLARAELRALRATAAGRTTLGCDIRPDGRAIAL